MEKDSTNRCKFCLTNAYLFMFFRKFQLQNDNKSLLWTRDIPVIPLMSFVLISFQSMLSLLHSPALMRHNADNIRNVLLPKQYSTVHVTRARTKNTYWAFDDLVCKFNLQRSNLCKGLNACLWCCFTPSLLPVFSLGIFFLSAKEIVEKNINMKLNIFLFIDNGWSYQRRKTCCTKEVSQPRG